MMQIRDMEIAARAEAKGRQEGREESNIESIRNIMGSLKLTAQEAMDALKIPKNKQSEYASMI